MPIAVASGRCWPRRTFSFIPGVIDVSIGPPITANDDESAADLMARVEQWIEGEMRRIDADAYRHELDAVPHDKDFIEHY